MNHASPLLRIPTELRDEIYDFALGYQIFDIYCWRRPPVGFTTRILQKSKDFLALLATCHQIHLETHLRPFRLNAFRIKSIEAMRCWL